MKIKQIVKDAIFIIAKTARISSLFIVRITLKTLKFIGLKYLWLWRKWPKDMAYITIIIILLLFSFLRPVEAKRPSDYPKGSNASQNAPRGQPEALYSSVIDTYLKNTPMQGTGRLAIETARKYNLPRYLIVAIAKVESDRGRLGYSKDLESKGLHNPWGLGIHLGWSWPTWAEAYNKAGYTLRRHYFNYNLVDPSDIEEVWAPCNVDGNSCSKEWSIGVNQAGQDMLNIEKQLSK